MRIKSVSDVMGRAHGKQTKVSALIVVGEIICQAPTTARTFGYLLHAQAKTVLTHSAQLGLAIAREFAFSWQGTPWSCYHVLGLGSGMDRVAPVWSDP